MAWKLWILESRCSVQHLHHRSEEVLQLLPRESTLRAELGNQFANVVLLPCYYGVAKYVQLQRWLAWMKNENICLHMLDFSILGQNLLPLLNVQECVEISND